MPSGGISPYTYSWFPGGGTDRDESGLSAGYYMVTLFDSNGCAATASITLTQPAGMTITQDSVNQNGNCDGEASVMVVIGGAAPYTYSWSGGQQTNIITGQCAGDFCCTITDNNGCSQTTCVSILNATGMDELTRDNGQITIYPNPNTGEFTIMFSHSEFISSTGTDQIIIEIFNTLGQKVYNSTVNQVQDGYEINLSSEPGGIYLYRVRANNGMLIGKGKFTIQK
jgi:hypothetical protein